MQWMVEGETVSKNFYISLIPSPSMVAYACVLCFLALLLYILKENKQTNGCSSTFNPLTPKRNQHLISPNNITPESNIKVMKIKEMITN